MRRAKRSSPSSSKPALADRLAAPFQRFFAIEAASTILLLGATVAALVWANSPWLASYQAILKLPIGISIGEVSFSLSFGHWVNDALMAIFFFVVGMEIKHELVHGELSTRERAMFPVAGAIGGMVVPAVLYAMFHSGGPAAAGWGIPMATDIAFAVAALTVLGTRVAPGLKIFLLALAIVDDLGAVTVIALFYTHGVSLLALGGAIAGLGLIYAMQRAGFRSYALYAVMGVGVWAATLASGIHATVAGVMLGFLTPADPVEPHDALPQDASSPLAHLTAILHPWVAFVVMPVFAFANAGVAFNLGTLSDPVAGRVTLGVAIGLLIGKPVGITLVSWLAVRSGFAALPEGVGWSAIVGAGLLAGIGFTMALFITSLAFEDTTLIDASKVGIFVASVLATVAGLVVLMRVLPKPRHSADRAAAR